MCTQQCAVAKQSLLQQPALKGGSHESLWRSVTENLLHTPSRVMHMWRNTYFKQLQRGTPVEGDRNRDKRGRSCCHYKSLYKNGYHRCRGLLSVIFLSQAELKT